MKILITGANGFLGSYLSKTLLQQDNIVIATGKGDCRLLYTTNNSFYYEELDFTNPVIVKNVIDKYLPDVIVHGGAISRPDDCEINQELAYQINTEGTSNLLAAAKAIGAFFIFISTDFIFDGLKGMYTEDDLPNPVNYYGLTKLYAEEKVRNYGGDWAIIRTVLVYGKPNSGRENLLTIVKNKLEKGEVYSVFTDQLRTPTYVEDLAAAIVSVIEKKATGIFHISGVDQLSPYDMAIKTVELLGLNKNLLKAITDEDLAQIAKRPPITGFDISKAQSVLNYKPVSFEVGLKKSFLFVE